MIEQNYYQGFQRLCDRNEKMTRIPTKDELEKAGCEISGMCYLITKDGKQYNPAAVNPEIMDDHIRMMFTNQVRPAPMFAPTPYIPKPIEVPKMVHTEKDESIGKVCPQCKNGKTIEQFGKKAGRGGHRKEICIECEVKNRLKALEEITKLSDYQQKEVKHEHSTQKEPEAQQHPIGYQQDLKPETVSVEHARQLALEAYQLGIAEGERRATSTISEPTLTDLLGENWAENCA